MQRQYIKRMMMLSTDYNSFDSFGAESQIALLVMNVSAISVAKLSKYVNDFISMIQIQNQWDERQSQSTK